MPVPDTSSIGPQLLLQLFLIAINSIFAATEMAFVSINDNKIRRQAKEGDKIASKLLKMIEEPSRILSTIQVAITLSGYLGSAFAADNFAELLVYFLVEKCGITAVSVNVLNTISVVLITIILSYFTLILGELVPKRVALKQPEKIARGMCGIMISIATILKPVVWFLSKSTNAVLRLMGINPNDEDDPVSEDEIRMMIDIGEEKGTIASTEKEMIENIFEFNNTTAGEIMTHRTDMSVIWLDDTTDEIIKIISESGYSRFPVCGEDVDEVVGVLRTRTFFLNLREENPKPLAELIAPAYFAPMSVRADVMFRDMQAKKCHMAIVVDEYGGTSGLVTMEDLIEEIVGNIFDESDAPSEQLINFVSENLWHISGSALIDDICEKLNIDITSEDDEYTTLGGLIFTQLSQIPDDGSQPELDVKGLHIKVDKLNDRRIESAYVAIIKTGEEDEPDSGGKQLQKQKES